MRARPPQSIVPRMLRVRGAASAADPDTVTLPAPQTRTAPARPWNVIVWDDPINLMSYVVYVFQKLFGFSEAVANEKMLEVHNEGRSVVASCEREKAEFYVTRLHAYGLQATLEQVAG
ncbi:MAG: ATP-dependent Clp protease adapter ClpS [Planctomycetes bacterium]|nr:ATP-dependent Clp protease adapter ClpS [Planctomycetota bacterium]